MEQPEEQSAAPPSPSFLNWKVTTSVAVAAVTAFIQTRFAIGRRMGSNFEELSSRPGTAAHEIQQKLLASLSEANDNPALHGRELAAKMGAIYHQHEKDVNGYWAARHVTGMKSRLLSMKPHQRMEVLFGAVAVFTVALGVAIGFAKSEEVANFFRRHKDADTQARPSAQRD